MSDQAANTTQTSQQSSSQQSQSGSGDQTSNGASNLTTPAERPDYVPEQFWDPTNRTVKAQEFTSHLGELAALKAQTDARLAARPAQADGYKLEFSEGFKPEVAIKFDETDPRLAPLRAFAHEAGFDQNQFSKLLEIEAARVTAESKMIEQAAAAEIGKLGANGPARVTAVKTWLTGLVGDKGAAQLMDRAVLSSDVELLEKLQLAFSNQGGSTYNNGGRETPAAPKTTVVDRWYGSGKAS